MVFVVLCPGTPDGSTGSGSGCKASQKTGQLLCSLKIRNIISKNRRLKFTEFAALKTYVPESTLHILG